MTDRCLDALRRMGISTWRVHQRERLCWERCFVRQREDIRRLVTSKTWTVTVFRDIEQPGEVLRGEGRAELYDGISDRELEERLRAAWEEAAATAGPFYELPEPETTERREMDRQGEMLVLRNAAQDLCDAAFSADSPETPMLYLELFAESVCHRITASNGLDVSFLSRCYRGEFTVCHGGTEPVELYRDFAYREPDAEALGALIRRASESVRARAKAVPGFFTGTLPVVFTGEAVRELLSYGLLTARADRVLRGSARHRLGEPVQKTGTEGELLELVLEPDVEFSDEGIPMGAAPFVEQGILTRLHGETKYMTRLGQRPCGVFTGLRCGNGGVPLAELTEGPCLIADTFSDFQLDPDTGDFAGELRLGCLKDRGETWIYGGSVSGNLYALSGDMRFSRERYRSLRYIGPYALRLSGVSLSGMTVRDPE